MRVRVRMCTATVVVVVATASLTPHSCHGRNYGVKHQAAHTNVAAAKTTTATRTYIVIHTTSNCLNVTTFDKRNLEILLLLLLLLLLILRVFEVVCAQEKT